MVVYATIVMLTIVYAMISILTNDAKDFSNAFAKEFRMLKLC